MEQIGQQPPQESFPENDALTHLRKGVIAYVQQRREDLWVATEDIDDVQLYHGLSTSERYIIHSGGNASFPAPHDEIMLVPKEGSEVLHNVEAMFVRLPVILPIDAQTEDDVYPEDVFIEMISSRKDSTFYLLNSREFSPFISVDDIVENDGITIDEMPRDMFHIELHDVDVSQEPNVTDFENLEVEEGETIKSEEAIINIIGELIRIYQPYPHPKRSFEAA